MEKLYDLKDKLCEELEAYSREPEMKAGDLEVIHKLTDTIKNIDKIMVLEEDVGYSQAIDADRYDRGSSYAGRGRGRSGRDGRMGYGPRRDSRGRYSRDDGRSEMMEHLEMALDSATEQDREDIRRFMKKLENA